MKNIMKRVLFTFVCTLAFLFVGVVTVKAAELNNTTISGYTAKYNADGSTYYYVNAKKDEKKIVLKAKKSYKWTFLGAANYRASVAVVTCSGKLSTNGCTEWSYYNYDPNEYTTMDALKSKSGLTIDLSKMAATKLAEVNGVSLGTLTSFYGVEDTYFILVQYTSQSLGLGAIKEQKYDAEVFKVVYAENVSGLSINGVKENGVAKITVTSGTPITNVRYFHTNKDLQKGFDYQTEYTSANNGVEVLTEMEEDPKLGNGVFKYEFSFNIVGEEDYYIEATEVSGNKSVYDLNEGTSSGGQGGHEQDPGSNVGNTPVGKYILIALLVVLVLSLVLVIVQRIVDYRKKLY